MSRRNGADKQGDRRGKFRASQTDRPGRFAASRRGRISASRAPSRGGKWASPHLAISHLLARCLDRPPHGVGVLLDEQKS